jgi:hypothetical protein
MVARGWGALALVVLLAGCSSGPSGNGNKVRVGDSTVTLQDVQNTQAGTGGVTGVVVDEAIRPMAGVRVFLGVANRTTNTTADGLFSFGDLEPGLYTLRIDGFTDQAAGKRYMTVQTTADVAAGAVAKVRIVVPLDPAPVGYHSVTVKHDGFYQVSSGFVDEILDLYVWNQTYGPATTPNGPECTCRWSVTAEGNVSTLVADLVWEEPSPGNPAPEFWTMDLEWDNGSGSAPLWFCEDGSPCSAHFQQAGNFTGATRDFSIGVWTDPSWVYVNQKFELFVTLFYVEPAPADWTFESGT